MQAEAAEAIVSAIAELAAANDGLFAKLMALEKVLKVENPALYQKYLEVHSRAHTPRAVLEGKKQTIDKLRTTLLRDC